MQLRVLDLQSNRIRSSVGLESLSSLEELYACWNIVSPSYLAYNGIPVAEGMEGLENLNTLDLTYNFLTSTKGFGGFKSLEFLWVASMRGMKGSCRRRRSGPTTLSPSCLRCPRRTRSGVQHRR